MIRVLSFVGSCAGESSHTKQLSDRLAAALSTKAAARGEDIAYECFTADQLRVSFCRSCNSCFSTGVCPLDASDDIGSLKQKMLEADVILFGTPVYLAEMSGASKCVLDRIAFWTHRLELAGKAGMVLVTTSNNHGSQVEQRLSELLRYTGLAAPEGLCLQLHARPRLDSPEESEPSIEAAAERLLGAMDDPVAYLTGQQELLWKGLALNARRKMMWHYLYGDEIREETRVLDKRRVAAFDSLASYVRHLRLPQEEAEDEGSPSE